MEEDRTFELVTKIYSELTGFRKETNERLQTLKKDVLRIETKLYNDSAALFDGYKQTYEAITEIQEDVKVIHSNVEKNNLEIMVIKGGKVNNG